MDTIFRLSALLVMPFWLLMIVAPGWRWTHRVMSSTWIVVPAAALYSVLVLPRIGTLLPILAAPELGTIAALLGSPEGAVIAWVHFLAFDLFAGRWVYLDSRKRGLHPLLMAPVLLGVFMFGPLGLVTYLGLRAVTGPSTTTRPETSLQPGLRDRTRAAYRRAAAINRPLALVSLAMIPLVLLTLVGIVVDPREITGAPAWVKPAKFAISIAVYCFTLLWLLGRVEGRERLVRLVGTGTAVGLGIEWVVIAVQAFRGQPSHFNVTTPLNGALFSIMGAFVILIWVMNFVAAALLLRQRESDLAFGWSLRLGLIVALVGGAMGSAMLRPTPEQVEGMQNGQMVTTVGAHSVGVSDGGAGLPFIGWSTEGGDFRPAHFFGLHGLQILPLLGWLLSRSRRTSEKQKVRLVWTGAAAYLGIIGILFWQALRSEPIVRPGLMTLGALGILGLTLAVAVLTILWNGRAAPREKLLTSRPTATVSSS